MNYKRTLTLLVLLVSYISRGLAENYDTLYVSDFGIMPNSRKNATLAMKKILLKGKEVHNPLILFEKGRYDFWPQHCEERDYYESNTTDINPKRLAFLIEEFEKLIIDGNGADFVFHDRMQAITLDHSKNIKIENVEIYHTAGLGILSQFSENISMDHVKMIPNPKKNRYLSGHDDGFHFSNCKGQINITNCEFAALMDDPLNIHGTSVRIIKKLGPNKLLCHYMHHQSVGLQWARTGEKIGFIKSDVMTTNSYGIVADFLPIGKEDFEITFAENIPEYIHLGDALENLSWTPDAYIADNKFMSCRARGILVSTPGKVLIERNYFESSGSAILIAGDANNWYETGAVNDITIRNNVFADPCLTSKYQFSEAIISIYPEIPNLEKATEKYHSNIRIENNEFHPFDYPVLYAKSVDGLIFKGNELTRSHRFKPFHSRKFTFSFENCTRVEISDNSYSGKILGRNVLLEGMKRSDYFFSKNQDLMIERKK